MRSSLAVAVLALLASGCAATGGHFLGYFPLPKLLSGSLEGGTYRPESGVFEVWAPFSDADGHARTRWRWGTVTEVAEFERTSVRFMPLGYDRFTAEVYPVLTGHEPTVTELVRRADELIVDLTGGEVPYEILFRGRSKIRPDLGLIAFSFDDGEGYSGAAAFYLGAYGTTVGVLRVVTTSNPPDPRGDALALQKETRSDQIRFVESFKVRGEDPSRIGKRVP